jgi:transcriptional regulator with XRE-family HTH domain
MNNPIFSLLLPGEACKALAGRCKALRLQGALTRETLAARAGVSPASLKRFETTGAASLDLVFRLAFTLGRLEDFAAALLPDEAGTLAEMKAREERPLRKRGRL